MRTIIQGVLVLLTTSQVTAAEDFGKLAWLSGCWEGAGLGGHISECWVQSRDNTFTGVFQHQSQDKLNFTEIVSLADFDGQPAMRVRHFNPDFSQWASDQGSYISFPLIAIEDQRIRFKGLEYSLQGDSLHIRLDMKSASGEITTQQMTLHRTPVLPR